MSESVPAKRVYSTKSYDIGVYKPRFACPAIEVFTRILCFTNTTGNLKKVANNCEQAAKNKESHGKIRKGREKVAKQMRKALRKLKQLRKV